MKDFTTKHSIERMKDRLGINERKAEKRITDAITRGSKANAFSSWERSFLENEARDGYTAIAYNGYCYIVSSDNVCITLYPLPTWFGKKKHFDGKEKIRNFKKYYNTHFAQAGNREVVGLCR